MKHVIIFLSVCGMLVIGTQGMARDGTMGSPQVDGFSPPDPARTPRHGYWSTPEGKQAAAEIRYQQAQQAYDRFRAQSTDLRTAAALQQYQQLMVSYTAALSNFGMNTGNRNPPLPVLARRNAPISDDGLKQDYAVVLKDYFAGIRMFGLGTAWKQPPAPPPLPPIQNKRDPEYLSYARALQIDQALVDRFSDRVYAAAIRSRQTPLPFAPQDNRPTTTEEQRWCEINLGSSTGRVPC